MFLLAGIVGYILGTTTFSTFFGDEASNAAPAAGPALSLRAPLVVPVPTPAPRAAAEPVQRTSRTVVQPTVRPQTSAPVLADARRQPARNDAADALGATARDGAAPVAPVVETAARNDAGTQQSVTTVDSATLRTVSTPSQTADTADARNAAATSVDAVAKSSTPATPIDPSHVLGSNPDPIAESDPAALSLRTDGFEASYGHLLSRFGREASLDQKSGVFSNITGDISYRFLEGRVGVGARFGYGSVPINVAADTTRAFETAPSYTMHTETKQLLILDLFANYRVPVSDRIAIGLEGSFGGSLEHAKAGGSAFAVWFLTEQIAIQAGGGLMHFWYSSGSQDFRSRLLEDGASVDDRYRERTSGMLLEGKYGVLLRF